MIQAIVALAFTVVVAASLREILSGLIELLVGVSMMVIGATLYCLSFPAQFLGRAFGFGRRRF